MFCFVNPTKQRAATRPASGKQNGTDSEVRINEVAPVEVPYHAGTARTASQVYL